MPNESVPGPRVPVEGRNGVWLQVTRTAETLRGKVWTGSLTLLTGADRLMTLKVSLVNGREGRPPFVEFPQTRFQNAAKEWKSNHLVWVEDQRLSDAARQAIERYLAGEREPAHAQRGGDITSVTFERDWREQRREEAWEKEGPF